MNPLQQHRSLFSKGGRSRRSPGAATTPAASHSGAPPSAEKLVPHVQAAWRGKRAREGMFNAVARRGPEQSPQRALQDWVQMAGTAPSQRRGHQREQQNNKVSGGGR